MRNRIAGVAAVAAAVWVLYGYGLTATGLLGPDEPRYAAIGRAMAESGDWVTPRLWGEPWFEKPALLYWMVAAAFRAGVPPDLAPRLPVVLTSLAFLWFYFTVLRREFGAGAAGFATAILATSAGWLALSQIAVTDLPMSAAVGAAMLLALPWAVRGDARRLPWAAAWLGVAVLGKGLVPLALAGPPLLAFGWRRWRDPLRPRVWAAFLAAAAPWYVLCYVRNGWPFVEELFIEHHFSRFASERLQHVQPWWFYAPVLLGGLFPWTPLLGAVRAAGFGDARVRFFAAWAGFGFLFFSASTNKLPGYLLPLFPALAALLGVALHRHRDPRAWLAGSALLLGLLPVIAGVLPVALASGLSRARWSEVEWPAVGLALAVAVTVWLWPRARATALIAGAAAIGVLYLKASAYGAIDRAVSSRPLWIAISGMPERVCVESLHRARRYGLNYYSRVPLPDCPAPGRDLRIVQHGGQPPRITP